MVLIFDFDAMNQNNDQSADYLTCLPWPCLSHLLASYWTVLTFPVHWLADVGSQLSDNFQVVSRPRQLIDLFPLLLSFPLLPEETCFLAWLLPTHHESDRDRKSWDPIYYRVSKITRQSILGSDFMTLNKMLLECPRTYLKNAWSVLEDC